MIISYFSDSFGRHGFRAEPGEYDAHPQFSELMFDAAPQLMSPARQAAAGFLAFYHYASGGITLPGLALPLSAQWMEKIANPTWVNIAPIDYAPKDAPKGTLELNVILQDSVEEIVHENKSAVLESINMHIVPSGNYRGAIFDHKNLIISSNAWLFSDPLNDEKNVSALLAMAIIFSEDLHINHIKLRSYANLSISFVENVTGLLKSVGLSVEFNEIPGAMK